MPNHNTTILDISGTDEEVAAWFARHVLRVESKGSVSSTIRDQFDFETVIPRPASIKATSRPDGPPFIGDLHVELYAQACVHRERDQFPHPGYPQVPNVATWGQAKAWLEKEHPAAVEWGRRSLLAAAETGFRGWYEWSYANWNTKWNSYQYVRRSERLIKFETANGVARPVFKALSRMHPTMTFSIVAMDEGDDSEVMVGQYVAGVETWSTVRATPALYRYVYGRDPYTDEDDETPAAPSA
jgi:hypothetical protein